MPAAVWFVRVQLVKWDLGDRTKMELKEERIDSTASCNFIEESKARALYNELFDTTATRSNPSKRKAKR